MGGRPRASDEGTQTRTFSCWPSLWQEVRKVAADEGKSISEFIREALVDKLKSRNERG